MRSFIVMILVVVLVGLGFAVIVPNVIKARSTRSINTCVDLNLPALASAKTNWAVANGKGAGKPVSVSDLLPYLGGRRLPKCPVGGTYILGEVGVKPACSLTNLHALP